MAKKKPNHPHQRDEPARNTGAPTKAPSAEPRGRPGQGSQDHGDVHGTGQFGGAGDAPLMKK
jgi:hypothetical protein